MSVFNSIFNSGARPAGLPSIAGLISSVLDRPGGSPNSYSNGGNAAAPKAAVVGPSRPPWTGDESDGYPSTQDRAGNPFWWRGNPYVRAYYDAYKADPVTCHCGSCGMKVIEGQAPVHARPVEVMVLEIQDEVLAAAGTPPPSDLSALPPKQRQAAERVQQALYEAKVKAEAEIWARQVEDQMDSFRRNGDIAAVKAITSKWQLDVNLRQRAMIHERGLAWYEKYPHSAAAIIAKYFVEPPQPKEAVTVPAATVLQSAAPPPDDASVAASTAPTHEPAATTGNVTTIAATTTAKKAPSRDHREAASAFVIKGTMERAMMAKPNYTHAAAAASGSSGSGGGQPAHKKSKKAKTRKVARNARKLEAKSKAAAGVDSTSQDRCEIF